MAVQNSTVERPAPVAPALSPADIAAHEAASYVAPRVDVAQILTDAAALLRAEPTRILTELTLIKAVLQSAGPGVTTGQLRPVWEALPLGPSGNGHAEYAGRLLRAAREL